MARTQEQKDLLQKVIDWLKAGAPETKLNENTTLKGFDFGQWTTTPYEDDNNNPGWCGSTGCIAGAAVQFAAPDIVITHDGIQSKTQGFYDLMGPEIGTIAEQLLDLTPEDAFLLFSPFDDYRLDWIRHLKPEKIAITLQHFQDTNEIDWELAR
jgi:hypothetical protein